jgi:hypothetical protein
MTTAATSEGSPGLRVAAFRALGFFVPTAALVTTRNLVVEPSVGAAIDGVVSGAWFALIFLGGAILGGRLLGGGAVARVPAGRDLARGLGAGVAAWGLVWLGWMLPFDALQAALRPRALLVNSVAMMLAAIAVVAVVDARRAKAGPAAGGGDHGSA